MSCSRVTHHAASALLIKRAYGKPQSLNTMMSENRNRVSRTFKYDPRQQVTGE
jgi:hypothetical protein